MMRNPANIHPREMLVVDALVNFGGAQYTKHNMLRDINKLYAALYNWKSQRRNNDTSVKPVFATGHWGCGVFSGNAYLKALQQLLVASALGMDLHYYTWHAPQFEAELNVVVAAFHEKKLQVGHIIKKLLDEKYEVAMNEMSTFQYLQHEFQLHIPPQDGNFVQEDTQLTNTSGDTNEAHQCLLF